MHAFALLGLLCINSASFAAGLPDWSSTWEIVLANRNITPASAAGGPRHTPYDNLNVQWNAAGRKKFEQIAAIAAAGGDVPSRIYKCVPAGMPLVIAGVESRFEVLFTPGRVTILLSPNNETRRIYTDGRAQQSDPDLCFDGSSVGHWQGASLLIDTVGLDPKNEFIYGIAGGPHMHVTERMFLQCPDVLEIDTVLEAPQMLSAPYRYTKTYRRSKSEMMEAYCAQNNRDYDEKSDSQGVDLTPPSNFN